MGWTEAAAGLSTHATVTALEAAKDKVNKRQYKRLIATAVAQLLELHPDIGRRKARRRARQVTGAKPSRKLMRARENLGWKEGAGGAVAAAATAGVAKVAGIFGEKLQEKFGGDGVTVDGGRETQDTGGAEPRAESEAEEAAPSR
jgi:hypothetical protein